MDLIVQSKHAKVREHLTLLRLLILLAADCGLHKVVREHVRRLGLLFFGADEAPECDRSGRLETATLHRVQERSVVCFGDAADACSTIVCLAAARVPRLCIDLSVLLERVVTLRAIPASARELADRALVARQRRCSASSGSRDLIVDIAFVVGRDGRLVLARASAKKVTKASLHGTIALQARCALLIGSFTSRTLSACCARIHAHISRLADASATSRVRNLINRAVATRKHCCIVELRRERAPINFRIDRLRELTCGLCLGHMLQCLQQRQNIQNESHKCFSAFFSAQIFKFDKY